MDLRKSLSCLNIFRIATTFTVHFNFKYVSNAFKIRCVLVQGLTCNDYENLKKNLSLRKSHQIKQHKVIKLKFLNWKPMCPCLSLEFPSPVLRGKFIVHFSDTVSRFLSIVCLRILGENCLVNGFPYFIWEFRAIQVEKCKSTDSDLDSSHCLQSLNQPWRTNQEQNQSASL